MILVNSHSKAQVCVTSIPKLYSIGEYGEYLTELVMLFQQTREDLREDGTLWIHVPESEFDGVIQGVPWAVAMALQEDGWYLRSDIIWRTEESFEYLFLLSKQRKYFYDNEAVREKAKTVPHARGRVAVDDPTRKARSQNVSDVNRVFSPDGKRNLHSVWSQDFEAILEKCIRAGTSERGGCEKCGKPWKRKMEKVKSGQASDASQRAVKLGHTTTGPTSRRDVYPDVKVTVGWEPQCKCEAKPLPQIVLDPFNKVEVQRIASKLGRQYATQRRRVLEMV